MRTNNIRWNENVDMGELRSYRLSRINRQLSYMAERSSHWSRILGDKLPLCSFDDFEKLPTMDEKDILRLGTELVCVSGRGVRRIVSLKTSGTSAVKRIYFTDNDIERTVSFFAEGMKYMCRAGKRAVIFLPGTTNDGVSDLLKRGLARIGVDALAYGAIENFEDAARLITERPPDIVIGPPACVRRLSLMTRGIRVRRILLSSDYVSRACIDTVHRAWGAEVFEHYGMTETCFGLAVGCSPGSKLHIRNDDFYIEILDPVTKKPLPEGDWGIVTVTTLNSEAMPLLRYMTGDVGALSPCSCGLAMPALTGIKGRYMALREPVNIHRLDDILCSCDEIEDYAADLRDNTLTLTVLAKSVPSVISSRLTEMFPGTEIIIENCHNLGVYSNQKRILNRSEKGMLP